MKHHIPFTAIALLLAAHVTFAAAYSDLDMMVSEPAIPADSVPHVVSLSGNVYTGSYLYGANGIDPHRSPFSGYIGGNLNLSIYKFNIPFSFILSEQERSFQQPFNQFGLSPKYKWLTLHGGYRNLSWSDYTLGGHTFLGGGIELTPGKFRFGAMYGKFTRATQTDTIDNFISTPAFDRYGYTVKLGVGSSTNYVDLIVLHAKDDPSSIPYDTSSYLVTPAENLVAGIRSVQKIGKHFQWDGECAFSIYTDDAAVTDAIFENSKELLALQNAVKDIITVNASTGYHSALQSSFGYTNTNFSAKIQYKRIGPEYNSMGTYFLMNDIQNITLQPSFKLWKRKVIGSGSIGMQQDNLSGAKGVTSRHVIGSALLQVNPKPHYGVSFNYTNYSTGQKAALMELNDTTRIALVSQNFSIVPRYTYQMKKMVHTAVLVYSLQTLQDKNIFTSDLTSYNTNNINATYSLTYLPWAGGATLSYNQNTVTGSTITTAFSGVSIGANKSFLKNTLSTSATLLFNGTKVNNVSSGNITNINIGAGYQLHKKHRFSANITRIQFNSSSAAVSSYDETTAHIAYTFIF